MRGPIYLAGRYSRIDELNTYRQALEAEGLSVRARWLDGEHQARSRDLEASDPGSARAVDDPDGLGRAIPDEALGFARDDLHDVLLARTIVSFTEAPRSTNSRGGRHVELGIGIGRRGLSIRPGRSSGFWPRLYIVGPRENVFHTLVDAAFSTFEELLDAHRGGTA